MDFKKLILEKKHNRQNAETIADYIGTDKKKFKELMKVFMVNEYRLNQRAAWSVLICSQRNPQLIQPYLSKLLAKLDEKVHNAVIRNTIRIFEDVDIPEKLEGQLYDKCFFYLTSMDYPVAIKAFSLTVATKIAMKYPELQTELLEVIDYQLPHSTAAFKFRAKRTRALFLKK